MEFSLKEIKGIIDAPSFDRNKALEQQIEYKCSNKILCGLGRMYAGGGDLTENIDAYGGNGTAEFVSKAIDIFCME